MSAGRGRGPARRTRSARAGLASRRPLLSALPRTGGGRARGWTRWGLHRRDGGEATVREPRLFLGAATSGSGGKEGERGRFGFGVSRPPPPPGPIVPIGAGGDAAPGGGAGRPLASPRPRLREAESARGLLGPWSGRSRDPCLCTAGCFPGHPAAFLWEPRELPAPHCQAEIGCDFCSPLGRACPNGNWRKPKRAFLRSAPSRHSPACLGKTRGSLSGGFWEALLFARVSVSVTLILNPVLIRKKKKKKSRSVCPSLAWARLFFSAAAQKR